MAKIVLSANTAKKIEKHLRSEINDLKKKLKIIELEIKMLEGKYGVSSIELEKCLKEKNHGLYLKKQILM